MTHRYKTLQTYSICRLRKHFKLSKIIPKINFLNWTPFKTIKVQELLTAVSIYIQVTFSVIQTSIDTLRFYLRCTNRLVHLSTLCNVSQSGTHVPPNVCVNYIVRYMTRFTLRWNISSWRPWYIVYSMLLARLVYDTHKSLIRVWPHSKRLAKRLK